jgi:hypothetical protein
MYIARFDLDSRQLVQVSARIECGSAYGQNKANWDWVGRQLSAAIRSPGFAISRRIRLDQNRKLQQIIALTAPSSQEASLRVAVANLTRAERFPSVSMSLPATRADRDQWFDLPGTARFCTAGDNYFIRGIPVACDFRILPLLNSLLVEACLAGYEVTYQVHIRSIRIDPEHIRQARRFVVELRDVPVARERFIADQQRLAWRMEQAAAICEEYLCVESHAGANWLKLWLSERFRQSQGALGFDADLSLRPGAFEDALTSALHSYEFDPWAPADLSGGALTADERDSLIGWKPDDRLDRFLPPGDPFTEPPASPPPVPGPKTYSGEDRFVFASYKRQDLPAIASVLNMVRGFGVPVWYDAHIPGGFEWDEVIEERLQKAKGILAFTSAAAIASRYVRREVKYADTLGRPVLGILLEDVKLRYGLEMMMTQYQMLDVRAANFESRLREAVTRIYSI